ncbi:MarR family transcriptional regulator [Protaetiibacter mangrovi]|nr:MarR family transcriptional regulator [Schumannella luteola]
MPPEGFVDRMSAELVAQGFPRIPARVLMALTGTPDARLTAAELAAAVEASPAAISGAVKYLELVGMVRRLTVPGTRRHLYALSDDDHPWYASSLTRAGIYAGIVRTVRAEAERLPDGVVRNRVDEMADFFAYIERRMPLLLDEWREERRGQARATRRSNAASSSESTD